MSFTYDKFYNYLEELDGNYMKMIALLREKMDVIVNDDLARLEEIMNEEQVFLLLSKGFDKNIADFREGLGFKGETLGEIAGEAPEEHIARFADIHSRLRMSLSEVKSLNGSCQQLMETKLYSIKKKLRELDKKNSSGYGPDNKKKPPGSHIFSKSV
ncbi:hypothetical protein FACS1894191_8700 [Clostridia bacterium]|nr:hypothetical protein FACS1894191_8700 [Clostridia bacterium]